MNNAFTFQYLGGIYTTVQNKMDMFRNIIHFSHKTYDRGHYALTNEIEKPFWERLIQMSGVTEFSDFFSRSMINSIAQELLELDVANGIYHEMVRYWVNIDDNKMSLDDARKEFEKNIDIYLSQSDSVTKASEIVIEENKKMSKAQLKHIKQEKRLAITNRLVNLAITKQYVARDAFKAPGFKNRVKNYLKGPADNAISDYI